MGGKRTPQWVETGPRQLPVRNGGITAAAPLGYEPDAKRSWEMNDNQLHDEPSNVEAKEGAVCVDGPDQVDVKLTPEAAEETSERLTEEAMRARGQRRLGRLPHRHK